MTKKAKIKKLSGDGLSERPAEGAWSFETADVAENFDAHVRSQLPWYDFVTKGLVHIARHYVSEGGGVIDLGASTGNVAYALQSVLKARSARIYGVEKSEAMIEAIKRRGSRDFVSFHPYVNVWNEDATNVPWADKDKNDLIVAFLFVMFVPPKKRRKLLHDLWCNLAPGGALVVVDRTALASGYASQVLNRLTLAGKLSTGVSPKEIIDKELSLAGVQRPLDPEDLPGNPVEWFRYGDFAGWLIEKGAA